MPGVPQLTLVMSGHPQQLASQKVPTYRQILLHQLYVSPCIMSFDPVTTDLVTWFWYMPFAAM
jgi:hypothetical protein